MTGLGYDLVDCERSAAGLLRVSIDKLPEAAMAGELINVDDCERVTRQLQYVLEVENVPYERLEVSSPGLDRPLKKAADYARFVGEQVQITLREAFQGRKKYKGVLSAAEGESGDRDESGERGTGGASATGWRIVFNDGKVDQALDFSLEEVREAQLVPALSFKGRKAAGGGGAEAGENAKAPAKKPAKRSNAKARQSVDADEQVSSGETAHKDDKVDGGPDQ